MGKAKKITKPKRTNKKRPKGDDMAKGFHVEQLKAQGLPPTAPEPLVTITPQHNNSGNKPTAGQPTLYDFAFCEALIDHMSKGLSFESFGAALPSLYDPVAKTSIKRRAHRDTLYAWAKAHPEFSDAKKIGFEACQLFWERLGVMGASGKYKGFNAVAWLFNMKNRFRKDWKDRHDLNVKGSDNGGSNVQKAVFLIPSNGREAKDVTPKKVEGEND